MFQSAENLAPLDGELYLFKQFYPPDQAEYLLTELLNKLPWQEEKIFIFGKWVKVPRLMCWFGDPEAEYTYSGVKHTPLPWTPELLLMKAAIEQHCQHQFNSVLANLYRDGQDSMGCHADNEKELGLNPVIASLSLGDERVFKLHHNKKKHHLDLILGSGDLLLMAGTLQHHWVHSIPKTKKPKSSRINLTFRLVHKN